MGEQDMKCTFAELALITAHTEGKMREFAEQLYAGMAQGSILNNIKHNHYDETVQYYDEQWKHDRLVPDSAVELVDEMF